jgi:hypothetical protein
LSWPSYLLRLCIPAILDCWSMALLIMIQASTFSFTVVLLLAISVYTAFMYHMLRRNGHTCKYGIFLTYPMWKFLVIRASVDAKWLNNGT